MRNTKFVVLSLKDVMKNIMFVVLGIALIMAMILIFSPEKEKMEEMRYIPGKYETEITLDEGYSLFLTVVLTEDKIEDIYISNLTEEQNIFYPLIEPTLATVKTQVIKNQSTYVSVNPEIMETSKLLITAVEDAIYQGIEKQ